MNKIIILLIFFMLITTNLFAQNYEWSYTNFMIGRGDIVYNVLSLIDSCGNLIFAGTQSVFSDYPFMYNISNDGNKNWGFLSTVDGRIKQAIIDDDNNIFVCGIHFSPFSNEESNFYTNQIYNKTAEVLWSYSIPISINNATPDGLLNFVDGNFKIITYNSNIIGCGVNLKNDSLTNLVVFKIDENGKEIWKNEYSYSENFNTSPFDLTVDENSNIYVCGYSENADSSNSFLVKYDINGNFKWYKVILNKKAVSISNITTDPNSIAANILIAKNNPWVSLNTEDKKFLLQLDSSGNTLNSFVRTTDKKILGINKDQENNIYQICADSIFKYNIEGKLLESVGLPGNLTYTFYDFDSDSNIYIVAKKSHFFTAKLNNNLQIEWTSETKIPDKPNFHNESFIPYSIIGSTNWGVFITGVSHIYDSTNFNSDNYLVTVKLSASPNDIKNKVTYFNKFYLSQNYPNPFNPTTTINFTIHKSSFVTLKVYNVLGKEVRTLVNKKQNVGNYQVEFNGSSLSSGIYFYRLNSGDYIHTRKMILLK